MSEIDNKKYVVKSSYKYGIKTLNRFVQNELLNDKSIEDIRFISVRPSDSIETSYASKSEYHFSCDVPDKYMIFLDKCYLKIRVKFQKSSDSAITVTDKDNIASAFNMFNEADVYLNTRMISRNTEIGHVNRALSYLTHSKSNLKHGNGYWLNIDDPYNDDSSDATNFIYDQTYATATSTKLMTHGTSSAIADTDGKIITITGGGTNSDVVTSNMTTAKYIQLTMRTLPTCGNYLHYFPDSPQSRRKQDVIDTGSGSNIYTFRVPLSYFMCEFYPTGDNVILPANKLEIRLRRNTDAQYLICESDTAQIDLQSNGLSMEMCYHKYNPIVMDEFYKQYRQSPLVIPTLKFDYRKTALTDGDTSYLSLTKHRNLSMVLNFFTSSTQKDVFKYRLPQQFTTTLANNAKLYKRFKYVGARLYDSTNELISDPSVGDAVGYEQYIDACLYHNTRSDLAISNAAEWYIRPLIVTHINMYKSPNMTAQYQKNPELEALEEEFTFVAGSDTSITNNTVLHSIYVSQNYLVFTLNKDGKTSSIDVVNRA
jgi:hypothetical protein